ncbi:predicted protein [Naegleria gruberi]|uniref:Predicted protein n=1 Tax=Naegleria gruberi TaxID=5762 RepID=D2V6J6_NAEGR|nr:uncharacterized protein NAEGRDRAFT_64462 [Naegleria gruberi]EFC47454.1 predicted protein [Naegleria gruberi]|eukprot:XP_002680198.1 predicted protein [Naegleria gruberi strain NEG-M]
MKTNNHKSKNKSYANDSSIERLLDALDQIFSLLEQFSFANISHFLSIPMQYVGKIASRLAISGGKVGSNLFDTVLDLLTPVSTLFDQYQTYYGYYRGSSYFNANELVVTRIYNYLERQIVGVMEKFKNYFSSQSNANKFVLKSFIVGGLLLIWRLMYVYWRFKRDYERNTSATMYNTNFIDGHVSQTYVDDMPLAERLKRRSEWERERKDPFSRSNSDMVYMNSPKYYLQNPYFPLQVRNNPPQERNFFTYYPSYRNRVEDLEFRDASSTINHVMERDRNLVGLRRRSPNDPSSGNSNGTYPMFSQQQQAYSNSFNQYGNGYGSYEGFNNNYGDGYGYSI